VETYQRILNDVAKSIEQELSKRDIRASLKYRVKSFESYFKKILLKLRESQDSDKTFLTDLLGIRIVCPFLETLSDVEDVIRELFHVVETDKKGEKHSFREFGYEATHLLIALPVPPLDPEGTPVECAEIQIRTILQDAWAEVEHELVYKAKFNPFDKPLKRKLAALNANLTLSDINFQEIRDYPRQHQWELGQRRQNFSETVSKRTFPGGILYGSPSILKNKHVDDDDDIDIQTSTSLSLDDLLLRGLLAHNSGEYQKAIRIYSKILEHEDEKVKALVYVHRGMVHFAESRYKEALDDFSASLAINPQSSKTLYLRGITFRMMKNYPEALEDLRKAVALDPYQSEFWFAKAQVYFHSGDYLAARLDCAEALRLDPESKEYENFMHLLRKKSKL
ncbi:MAG: tetratricopeptide repeat protein, partial [Spirochaetia bacterium]|nr:tetratricopeptide repeat protein [Spirochaetia bacterium]